jgi:peptidoglycan/xylan/chitin deacetylase (PgdA/CDA1 family)
LLLKLSLQKLFGDRHLVYRLPADKQCVALTFDDGPHPVYTPLVLEVLRKNGIKATFFLIGNQVESHPDLARKILADGHAVGLHSYSHYGYEAMTYEQRTEDMARDQLAFKTVLGFSPAIFRPPHGHLSLTKLIYCIKNSIRTIMWDVDPEDYKKEGEDLLRMKINGMKLQSGSIILLHDDNPATVNVLLDIIKKVREAGFSFGTIE